MVSRGKSEPFVYDKVALGGCYILKRNEMNDQLGQKYILPSLFQISQLFHLLKF